MSVTRDSNHTMMTELWEWALFHHYQFLSTPIENHILHNPNIIPAILLDPNSRLSKRKILHDFYKTLDPRHHIIDTETLVTFDSINANVLDNFGHSRDWDALRRRIVKAIGIEILKKHLGLQEFKTVTKQDIKFIKVTYHNFDQTSYQNEINELYTKENGNSIVSDSDQQYLLTVIKINKTTKAKVEEIFEMNQVMHLMKDIGLFLRQLEITKFPVPRNAPIFFDQDVRVHSSSATAAGRIAVDTSQRRDTITPDLPGDFDAEDVIYQQQRLQRSQGRSPLPIQSSSSSVSSPMPRPTTTPAAGLPAVSPKPSTSVPKPVITTTTRQSQSPQQINASKAVSKPTQQEVIMGVRAATSALNAHNKPKDPIQAALQTSDEIVANTKGSSNGNDTIVKSTFVPAVASRTRKQQQHQQQQHLVQQHGEDEEEAASLPSPQPSVSRTSRIPAALETERRIVNVRRTSTESSSPLISSSTTTAPPPPVTTTTTATTTTAVAKNQILSSGLKQSRRTDTATSSSSSYPQTQPNDDYELNNNVQEEEGEEEIQPAAKRTAHHTSMTKKESVVDMEEDEAIGKRDASDHDSDSDFGHIRGIKLRISGLHRPRKSFGALSSRVGSSSSSGSSSGFHATYIGRPTKARSKFTALEDQALLDGVERHGVGRWREILEDPEFAEALLMRSNMNIKDRYRNILKSQEDNANIIHLGGSSSASGSSGNNDKSSSSSGGGGGQNNTSTIENDDEVEE